MSDSSGLTVVALFLPRDDRRTQLEVVVTVLSTGQICDLVAGPVVTRAVAWIDSHASPTLVLPEGAKLVAVGGAAGNLVGDAEIKFAPLGHHAQAVFPFALATRVAGEALSSAGG